MCAILRHLIESVPLNDCNVLIAEHVIDYGFYLVPVSASKTCTYHRYADLLSVELYLQLEQCLTYGGIVSSDLAVPALEPVLGVSVYNSRNCVNSAADVA